MEHLEKKGNDKDNNKRVSQETQKTLDHQGECHERPSRENINKYLSPTFFCSIIPLSAMFILSCIIYLNFENSIEQLIEIELTSVEKNRELITRMNLNKFKNISLLCAGFGALGFILFLATPQINKWTGQK